MDAILDELKNILHGKSYTVPREMTVEKLGKVFFNEGSEVGMAKYEEMKADLEKDSRWGMENELAYLASILNEEEKPEAAISVLQIVIDNYAKKPGPYLRGIGNIQAEMGENVLALKSYESALEADPDIEGVKEKIQELIEN